MEKSMKTKMTFAIFALTLAILTVTSWAALNSKPAVSAVETGEVAGGATGSATATELTCTASSIFEDVTVSMGGPGECAYEHSCMADCQAEFHSCILQYPNPPGGPLHQQCHTALDSCLNPACCL